MKSFALPLLCLSLVSCSPTNVTTSPTKPAETAPVESRSEAEINAEIFQNFFQMRDAFLESLAKINVDQEDFNSLVAEQTKCVEIVEKYNRTATEGWWVSLFYANLPLQLPGEKCLKL